MALLNTLMRQVAPKLPMWIKRPVGEVLSRSGFVFHHPRTDPKPNLWELPPDFSGAPWVSIGHKGAINGRDFPYREPSLWLDLPNAPEAVAARVRSGALTQEQADGCLAFARDGFFTAQGLIPEPVIDAAIEAYLRGRRDGTLLSPNNDRRYLNPHFEVPEVRALMNDPGIIGWVERLLDRRCIPFQSIGSEWGSEQLEHSDVIHMTTYPLGGLVAAWIACEDVDPDAGPLVYYPGSHKLPYYLAHDVGIGDNEFNERQYACYAEKYEPFIQKIVKDEALGLKPQYLHAKKGDVLFWHHNLIHGGSPIKNPALTRKAIVCHYFAKGVMCYGDLASTRMPPERLG